MLIFIFQVTFRFRFIYTDIDELNNLVLADSYDISLSRDGPDYTKVTEAFPNKSLTLSISTWLIKHGSCVAKTFPNLYLYLYLGHIFSHIHHMFTINRELAAFWLAWVGLLGWGGGGTHPCHNPLQEACPGYVLTRNIFATLNKTTPNCIFHL